MHQLALHLGQLHGVQEGEVGNLEGGERGEMGRLGRQALEPSCATEDEKPY